MIAQNGVSAVLCGACGAFIGPSSSSALISSSSLARVLHTNNVPSTEDRRFVVDVVPKLHAEITEIEKHIAHTTPDSEEMDQLLDLREQLLAKCEACRSLVSSFRLFPTEILAEIFVLCLGRPISHHRDPINTLTSVLHKPPMSLAQVCSRWRNIVITDRRNWTNIQITDVPPAMVEGSASLLRMWISRSRGLPLSVHVSARHPKALFDILLGEAHRWQQLSMHTSLLETMCLQKRPFPQLRVIHFLGPMVKGFKVMAEPPCLDDHDMACCTQVFPLRQITRLATGADLGWIAAHFANLTDLDLHCSPDVIMAVQNTLQRFTFRRLESLHLGFVGNNAEGVKALAAVLVLPKLHTLRITERAPLIVGAEQNRDGGCSCRAIHDLLVRSSCALRSLHLYNAYLKDEAAFLDCLRQAHDLTKLDIGGRRSAPVSDSFVSLLGLPPNDPQCLLPALKVLDIKVPLQPRHEIRLNEIIRLRNFEGEIDGNMAFQNALTCWKRPSTYSHNSFFM